VAGFDVKEHFPCVKKTIEMPIGEQFGSRGFVDLNKTPNVEFSRGFPDVRKIPQIKSIIDYKLSRHACYLIV
jgi:hypothetical protein